MRDTWKRADARRRYLEDRANGLCIKCRRAPARPGKCYCMPCALKASEAWARRAELRKSAQGNPLPPHRNGEVSRRSRDGGEPPFRPSEGVM